MADGPVPFFFSFFFTGMYDVAEQDGHRFPIPVPDVDERFREVPESDPFGMSGIIPGNVSG